MGSHSPVKFSDTVSFFIKESTPPHSVLYRLGPLHTNLVSVILTVTFSVLEMLIRRSTVRNKMILADGNAMVYDKKAVGEHFRTILPIVLTKREINNNHVFKMFD
jgi:hypothetical protein